MEGKKKYLVNIELREVNCDIPMWSPSPVTRRRYISLLVR